jgi:hypothetical protein
MCKLLEKLIVLVRVAVCDELDDVLLLLLLLAAFPARLNKSVRALHVRDVQLLSLQPLSQHHA